MSNFISLDKNQNFPKNINLDEFKNHLTNKSEIRFSSALCDTVEVACYMISDENTFNDSLAKECRGIVFNKETKQANGRPLHKFFNVNENKESQLKDLPWDSVARVMPKLDGSMIHTVKIDNISNFLFKSKKSFTSDVVNQVYSWLEEDDLRKTAYNNFCNKITKLNKTAIFEWISPIARIVILYKIPSLKLLHVRDNETGEYSSYEELLQLAGDEIPVVQDLTDQFNLSENSLGETLLKLTKTETEIEGWVVQFKSGQMVKLKTDWYLNLHHSVTFLRERDIAELVLDEKIDDLKSLMIEQNFNIDPVIHIEARVKGKILEISREVEILYKKNKNLSQKDFAILNRGHQYFTLLMNRFTGKEVNYKEYFKKFLLRDLYSLEQINFGDEDE